MKIVREDITARAFRLSIKTNGREVARAWLFLIQNDLHPQPYALIEDVYVEEDSRGQGIGTTLIEDLISLARELKCYKLIATSRHSRSNVHRFYEQLGFRNHGNSFRIDL